jgi:hypothetical protein
MGAFCCENGRLVGVRALTSHSLMLKVTSEPGPTALAQKHSEPNRVALTDL